MPYPLSGDIRGKFRGGLPFDITTPQKKSWGSIAKYALPSLAGALGLGMAYPGQPPKFPELGINKSDITEYYDTMMNDIASNVYRGLEQTNRNTAARLAQTGISNSAVFARLMGLNELDAQRIVQQLESKIGSEKLNTLMKLAEMEYQRNLAQYQAAAQNQQAQQQFWGGVSDLGTSLLMLALL